MNKYLSFDFGIATSGEKGIETLLRLGGLDYKVEKLYLIEDAAVRKVVAVANGGAAWFFTMAGSGLGEAIGGTLYNLQVPVVKTGYINVWRNEDHFSPLYATVHYSLEQANAERLTSCSGKKKVLIERKTFEYEA